MIILALFCVLFYLYLFFTLNLLLNLCSIEECSAIAIMVAKNGEGRNGYKREIINDLALNLFEAG